MSVWPEPVWFDDNDQRWLHGEGDPSVRRARLGIGEDDNPVTVSRSQLLLQYLLALDPLVPELHRRPDGRGLPPRASA